MFKNFGSILLLESYQPHDESNLQKWDRTTAKTATNK
jgi:hypothetical protein